MKILIPFGGVLYASQLAMASKERLEQARPMLMLDCEDALILHENVSPVERRHLALESDLIESLDLRSPTVRLTV